MHRGLVPSQSGWMTTSFFVSQVEALHLSLSLLLDADPPTPYPVEHCASYNSCCQAWHATIMQNGGHHQTGSCFWYQGESMPDGSPSEFDEDAAHPSCIVPIAHPLTCSLHTVMRILMAFPASLEFYGNLPGLSPFYTWSLTLVLSGTCQNVLWPSPKVREPDTGLQLKSGSLTPLKIWMKPKSFTASCSTNVWCSLQAALTSPVWKASWLLSVQTPLYPTMPLTTPPLTFPGGSMNSAPSNIPGPATVTDSNAFSNASSGVGISIVISSQWRVWHLIPGWNVEDRDIGWAEAVGFELLA